MKIRVQINDQSYDVMVGDLRARPITATIDGETFQVWPEGAAVPAAAALAVRAPAPAPAPIHAPAPAPKAAAPALGDKSKQVVAPIPGTILAVTVKEGQEVSFGKELCTLEAMKMKSAIRANRAGKIVRIRVAAGDRVSQNQALMDYED